MHAMRAAADNQDVAAALLGICSAFGVSAIFGGIVPSRTLPPRAIASRILIQEMPPGWVERYNSRGYVYRDPIVDRLQSERSPFSWRDAYAWAASSADVRLIKGEAREFHLNDGYVVPITLLDGSLAAISFGGDHIDLSPDDQSILGFAASYALGTLLQHRFSARRARRRVSAREYDCLLWAAEGKTDWEISVILGVSKSTVTKHILSAREKLGAVTKSHAIAIALRERILR
ncbi:MAG: LuxR family transcriptional regulator [Alphaproteobacteria bacterium]|nr:LuxR family transcriptional regulator [Alphaproteobacteria bacterium]